MELVGLGMRLARAVVEVGEVEAKVVALAATRLPTAEALAGPQDVGHKAWLEVDAVDMALVNGSPRLAVAAQMFERVSRAVRRTAALVRRIEAGWPRRGSSDDRRAMTRRQVARGVGERIARHADGEAAERLFDDLNERLDAVEFAGDLDQPVEVLIDTISRSLGLPGPVRDAAEARRMPGDGTLAAFRPDG